MEPPQPQVVGPYRVEARIGSGGMGTVYRAWDERLQRRVAIKSIHRVDNLSEERRERLRREARALAGLNHPAVAQVYDIVVGPDGREFIVMEYVEGTSLAGLLLGGPLPVQRVVDLAGQIAEGLHAAHRRGVVHRDLKAENVLVADAARAKILDFGLAKRIDAEAAEESLTDDGVVMGTTRAMSPEQAEGRQLDHRSDLFSLGSLMYELLTGRHPFQASSPLETMERVVSHTPPGCRRVNPSVPKALDALVDSLLSKDRELRPGSAEETATELKALAAKLEGAPEDPAAVDDVEADAAAGSTASGSRLLLVAAILVAAVAMVLLLLVW